VLRNAAAAQLALRLVRAASLESRPVVSVEALSEATGMSIRVLQYRCQAAGVTARNCARFVECLRATLIAGTDSEWAAALPAVDPRTLRRIVRQAGFHPCDAPTPVAFVWQQQFIVDEGIKWLLAAEVAKLCRTQSS
jgi:hypothetical protein